MGDTGDAGVVRVQTAPGGTYVVAPTATGDHVVATGTVAAGGVEIVSGSPLAAVGLDPILVHASGPMAVSEDAGPSAGLGVVSMPGIPLAAAIGA